MTMRSGFLAQTAHRSDRSDKQHAQTSERREKGLWTFLTWSFFLSQAIAADQALAGAAQRAAEEDAESTRQTASEEAAPKAPAFSEPVEAAQIEDGASRTVPASPNLAPVELALPEPLQVAATHEAGPAVMSHMGAVGSGTVPLVFGRVAIDLDGYLAQTGGILNPILDIGDTAAPPIVAIIDDAVGGIVKPIVGTVGDVLGNVVGVVDPVLDSVVDTVGGVVQEVTDLLNPVVDHVISPVLAAAGGLLGDVLNLAGSDALHGALADMGLDPTATLGELLSSAHDTVQSTLGQIASPATTLVSDVVEAVTIPGDAVHAALAPVTDGIEGVMGGLISTLGLSSGALLEFTSSTADLPHYELMSGGTYTDYGLTLQTAGSAMSTASPLETAADLAGCLLGAATDEPSTHTSSPAPHLSTLEDTRSLSDGLGL